jgi:multiple sugar transport system permease protein
MIRRPFRSPLHAVGFYVVVIVFIAITLFPLLWILRMSLVDAEVLAKNPGSILPRSGEVVFDDPKDDKDNPWLTVSYETIFGDPTFKKGLTNSVIIAGLTTLICLTIGSIAAYALARVRFLARKPVLSIVLAVSFFPAVAIIAPLFLQFTSLGIINTYWAVIIPDVLISLPLTVYLLVAYFRELPLSLEEAAKVDGASTWQAFWRITIPLSMPGVVTTGLLTFIFAWNEFLFANTFALDPTVQPATVLIPQFATVYTTDYGAQAAAAIVLTLPLVLLVLMFQKKIVSGLTAGATTG